MLDQHIGWQMHRGQMIDDLVAVALALAAHPAPTPVAGEGDGLAAVIAAHPRRPSLARGVERCGGCDTSAVGQPGWYAAHVADAIRAAGLAKP